LPSPVSVGVHVPEGAEYESHAEFVVDAVVAFVGIRLESVVTRYFETPLVESEALTV
jgi:hypothetical protein